MGGPWSRVVAVKLVREFEQRYILQLERVDPSHELDAGSE